MLSALRGALNRNTIQRVFLSFLVLALVWKGGKSLEVTWVLVGIAWCCVVDQWRTGARNPQSVPGAFWLLLAGFVGMTCASFIGSRTANYGLDEVFRTGALALIALWALRTADDRFVRRLHGVLAVSTLIACAIGIAVYLLQPVDRMVGTFFDSRFHTDYWPNAWANVLLLAWPVALWWLWNAVRSLPLRLLLLATLLGCLALSYSRGGMLVFGVQATAWIVVVALRHGPSGPWVRPVLIRTALVLLLSAALFTSANALRSVVFPVQSVAEKITFTASEGTSSVSERSQFWADALRMTAQHPLLGWGPYSFRFVQPRMQEHVLATSDHPHNVLLKLSAERGIPAMLLFAGAVCLVIIASFGRVRLAPWSSDAAMLVSVLGVLAHNSIDYNLQFVGIALPFWLCIGLLARHVPQSFAIPMRLQRIGEVVMVSLLMLVAVVEGRFLALSSFGRHAEAAGNTEQALLWYERSEHERFSRDLHLSRASLLLSKLSLPEAEAALAAYANQNEEDGRLWKLRGDLCVAQGDSACALAAYERAYTLHGWNDLSILRRWIEALRESGSQEVLQERKEEILTRMELFTLAIEQNTHFIALSHNVEELLLLTREMALLFPEEEPRLIVLGARASRNAEYERGRLESRQPGMLW